jgi:hypothetical protein
MTLQKMSQSIAGELREDCGSDITLLRKVSLCRND